MVTQASFRSRQLICFLVLALLTSSLALAQRPPMENPQGAMSDRPSSVIVKMLGPDGSPYLGIAEVNLFSFSGTWTGAGTVRPGSVLFTELPIGRYTVEVTAPGFKKASETVEISVAGQNQFAFITLVPESSDAPSTSALAVPMLAPNARKDLNKASEAIRARRSNEARKYLEKLLQSAPGNPDVNYLWGVYYSGENDWTKAKEYWEKAVQIYPRHALSLSALAQFAVQQDDIPSAIGYLSRAAEAEPSSWRFEEHLAGAYLRNKDYEQAEKHAEHAIELGKDRAGEARLILALALSNRNDRPRAIKTLETFLVEQPNDSHAAAARQLTDSLQKTEFSAGPLILAPLALTNSAAIAAEMTPAPNWMPPDIDESMPAVESGVACPVQHVREQAAKRVRDFIESVNKITATEKLVSELLDRSGFPASRETRSFDYVVAIQEIQKGVLNVEEYRNGSMDPALFPQQIATIGLPSLVLAFHPNHKDDYDVVCEGLSHWGGRAAWQVHFRQKPNQPARLLAYRIGGRATPVPLRGRAWIDADTFQVVRLETDIVSPLPEIRLKAEHISVDYGPVAFRKNNQKLWLPQTAELYFDFNGRRMHRRHEFSNYLLFAVDEREKISEPKITQGADPPAPSSPDNK